MKISKNKIKGYSLIALSMEMFFIILSILLSVENKDFPFVNYLIVMNATTVFMLIFFWLIHTGGELIKKDKK